MLVPLVGLVTVAYALAVTLGKVWKYMLRPKRSMQVYGADRGAWAVVTGASYGIGKGFAQECAKQGFNVVLVARSTDKLEVLSKELRQCGADTRVVSLDCASPAAARTLADTIQQLPVTLLINNVGVALSMPTELSITSLDQVRNMIAINCGFSTELTRLLIPDLVRHAASMGVRAGIVNLSSITAHTSNPLLAVYGATKAYNLSLSKSLSVELAASNVDVLAAVPGYVVSNMSGIRRTSVSVASAGHVARMSLGTLGKSHTICPYVVHGLMKFIITTLPTSIVNAVMLSALSSVREKQQKRAKRNKKD